MSTGEGSRPRRTRKQRLTSSEMCEILNESEEDFSSQSSDDFDEGEADASDIEHDNEVESVGESSDSDEDENIDNQLEALTSKDGTKWSEVPLPVSQTLSRNKMLGEYTVKRKTSRWSLALFFNVVNICALAAYVVYRAHNSKNTNKSERRQFLKDLSFELCEASVRKRAFNNHVIGKRHIKSAIEDTLGIELSNHPVNSQNTSNPARRDSTGRLEVVGCCHICRKTSKCQRKSRKCCSKCNKPVCLQHSISEAICNDCQ